MVCSEVRGQYGISDSFEEFHKFQVGAAIDFVLPVVSAQYLHIQKDLAKLIN